MIDFGDKLAFITHLTLNVDFHFMNHPEYFYFLVSLLHLKNAESLQNKSLCQILQWFVRCSLKDFCINKNYNCYITSSRLMTALPFKSSSYFERFFKEILKLKFIHFQFKNYELLRLMIHHTNNLPKCDTFHIRCSKIWWCEH